MAIFSLQSFSIRSLRLETGWRRTSRGQWSGNLSNGGILSNGLVRRVAAHNGLSLLDLTEPVCGICHGLRPWATLHDARKGRMLCDGSLSSPIASLFQTLQGKPPQEAWP